MSQKVVLIHFVYKFKRLGLKIIWMVSNSLTTKIKIVYHHLYYAFGLKPVLELNFLEDGHKKIPLYSDYRYF